MDDLFKSRVLTSSVNELKTDVKKVIYDLFFKGKEHIVESDRIAFDIIFGSERILPNISVTAEATVTEQTGRKTVTVQAPRIADKRLILDSYFNSLRGYGEQFRVARSEEKVAREQKDMKAEHDRTLEYWASKAITGVILDNDLTTELVNYNIAANHKPILTGTTLWSDTANSDPMKNFSDWKLIIEDDAKTSITRWVAVMGKDPSDYLIKNENVLTYLSEIRKDTIVRKTGVLDMLDDVEIVKYTGSFIHTDGTRKRFVEEDEVIFVGMCDDLTDVPYAPIIDTEAPGGVGNVDSRGNGMMIYSNSWRKKDPAGRWIKNESRPLPVLQRPGAVIVAKVL